MGFRSTSKCVYSAKYPLFWCPKCRRRVIGGRVEIRLKQIIHEVVAESAGQVIRVVTMPDHVHLLKQVAPTVGLSPLSQKKGRSWRQVRQQFPHLGRVPALWSRSWLVSTVGGAPPQVVARYVEDQKLAG